MRPSETAAAGPADQPADNLQNDLLRRYQELEERLTRLESQLAERPPLSVEEEMIVQRVLNRLRTLASERERAAMEAQPASAIVVPAAPSGPHGATPPEPPPEPPPEGVVLPQLAASPVPNAAPLAAVSWLQILAELRLMVTMHFDPHYRVSRLTLLLLLATVGLWVFDYFFFAVWFPVMIVSPIFERLIIVASVIFAYNLLRREVTRYQRARAYLARWYGR